MLYWPSDQVLIDPMSLEVKPSERSISLGNGQQIHTWHFKTPYKKNKGVFVQFHGNAENMTSHFQFFYWVLNEGYDLFVFDYRGYGKSSTIPITPESTVADGVAVLTFVATEYRNQNVIAVGQSLGGAVLMSSLVLLPRELQPQIVILDSTFMSYKDAASSVLKQRWFTYPLIPFVRLGISDKFAPKEKMAELPSQPKVVVHGQKDIVIRPELGEAVFAALNGPKEYWLLEQGVHTSAFSNMHGPAYRRKLINFIEMQGKTASSK